MIQIRRVMKKILFFLFIGEAFLCRIQAQDKILASRVEVKSPMIIETMDTCLKVIKQCQFFEDGIPSQVLMEYDSRRELYRCKICTQDDINGYIVPSMIKRKNPGWNPYYCYYHDVLFLYFVDDIMILGDIMDTEEIPYALHSKFYEIINEKDSLQYERYFIMTEDVQAYVYCKLLKCKDSKYSISSRPCPCTNHLDVLIDNSVKKVFMRKED